jgi:hypothetical protein
MLVAHRIRTVTPCPAARFSTVGTRRWWRRRPRRQRWLHPGSGRAAQDATPAATPSTVDPVHTTVPQVFAADDFEFQFLIALGQAYERAADVGECFAAPAAITDGDYDSWFDTFVELAERIRGEAEASDAAGHVVSALACGHLLRPGVVLRRRHPRPRAPRADLGSPPRRL